MCLFLIPKLAINSSVFSLIRVKGFGVSVRLSLCP